MTTAAEGVRVIDASRHMAGAMTGMMFADNGADVIKVEAPGGDPTREHDGFKVWNRGKRGVVIDLKDAAGHDRLLKLIATADVFITDFRQGAPERLRVDHASLAPYNSRLISVAISGFGEQGPLRDLPGYEHILAAKTGRMASMNGYRTDGPIFTPTPIASYGAAMLATQGALSALHQRIETGTGQRVHTSLLHALASYDMISGFGHRMHQVDKTGRIFGVLPLAFMTAKTSDERFIQMCSRQPHLFRNWLRVMDLEYLLDEPGLSTMPDLLPSQDELERVRVILADAMTKRPFAEWMEIFLREDVGGDPFLTAEEYLRNPQSTENGRTAEVDSPSVGKTLQIGPIAQMSETPSVIGSGEPLLGQHDAEVFASIDEAPLPAATAAAPAMSKSAPLAGITVLEVGYFYAAPFAMTLLAELGARVIKVEPPAGDPARRNWSTPYDKETVGKESIVADMKTPEGLKLVHELAAKADIFLHNFRPGVPERLGIGYAQLHEINPRLVYVYGGAFGSKGPWAKRPGFHSSPNAIAGSGIIEAGRDNPPINRTYADPAGALATGTAAMLGLAARDRTGEGQYVETTMLSSMAYTVSRWSVQYDGKEPGPLPDQGQHGFSAVQRLYPTASGWLFLQVPSDAAWASLVAELGQPALADERFATEAARTTADDELIELLGQAFAADSAASWESRLLKAGVPAVQADDTQFGTFILQSEQVKANGLAIPSKLPDGTDFWRSAGSVEFSAAPVVHGSAEPLGNSTVRILRELGYDDAAIEDLDARKVTHAVGHGLDG